MAFFAYPAVLFYPAGTFYWAEGWAFLLISLIGSGAIGISLFKHDRALFEERSGALFRKDQAKWDKVWMLFFIAAFIAWLPLAALDAMRFSWSNIPSWLEIVGGGIYAISLGALKTVFLSNTFLSPVVRIQEEREHKVIDTGPYALVRHPMYSVSIFLFAGASLLLGSLMALGLSGLIAVMFAIRLVLEEQTLAESLPGYEEYRKRVRYRLIPGIW